MAGKYCKKFAGKGAAMSTAPKTRATPILAAALICTLSPFAQGADLLGSHGDWKAWRKADRGGQLCFAASAATEQNPRDRGRGTAYVYVTSWPTDGIKSEISLNLGFILEKGAEVTADINGTSFTLIADGDRAYLGNAEDQAKMLEAMRRGKTMWIEAIAPSGMPSKDQFSLTGATAAVQAITSGCN